ncbi:MAG: S41 family peptidase [Acidobacteriota bacterium]
MKILNHPRSVGWAVATLLIAGWLTGCQTAKPVASSAVALTPLTTPEILTEEQARGELALLRKGLERLHPGYLRYATEEEIVTGWKRLDAVVEGGVELGTWYREISALLSRLGCEHSRAELPDVLETQRQEKPSFLPFRFRLFGDRMFIAEAADGAGLLRGDEVIALDGRPVREVLDALRPFVPIDGVRTRELENASLEDDGDFLGSTFEQFYPLVFSSSPKVRVQLAGTAGVREFHKVTYEDWLALAGPEARRFLNFKDAVTARDLDRGTAYLAVDTFVNYRDPVDPLTLLVPHFRRWNGEGKKRLIVDLRNNGGGSTDAMFALATLLVDGAFTVTSEAYIAQRDPGLDLLPFLSTWETRALKPKRFSLARAGEGRWRLRHRVLDTGRREWQPHEDHFRGEVIVLTSRFNASGTTTLHTLLKDNGFARLVGERTGGNVSGVTAGVLLYLNLPVSDITVRLPRLLQTLELRHPERFEPDRGIEPDALVESTLEGFLARKDEILEAARALPPESGAMGGSDRGAE